jgi:hypothetical protein
LQLKKENREMFKDGIHWSSLPRTFQDAATVVLNLGLNLLWIDSLCIIQDDDMDWRREAASMSQIYQNAFITISATNALGGERGLFSSISPTLQAQKIMSLTGDTLYFRPFLSHPSVWRTSTELELYHLLGRGWVLQERLLSPRTVHYTHDELYWECYEDTWCECQSPNAKTYDWRPKITYYHQLSRGGDGSFWHQIVEIYSNLNLTYPKDKLPAISGIARLFHQGLESLLGRYLAGLWEKRLDQDFFWTGGRPVPRPQPRAAPSWSWASVTGPVQFHAEPVSPNDSRSCRSIQFIGARVVPVSPDEYGEVASGELIISGLIECGKLRYTLPVTVSSSQNDYLPKVEIPCITSKDFEPNPSIFGPEEHDNKFQLNADYAFWELGDAFVGPGSDVYCLKTGVNISYGSLSSEYWVVLRRVGYGGRDVFERIGYLQPPQNLLSGDWVEEITIV